MQPSHDLLERFRNIVIQKPGDVCLTGPAGEQCSWEQLVKNILAWRRWFNREQSEGVTFAARLDLSAKSVALVIAAVTLPVKIAWIPLNSPASRERDMIINLGSKTVLIDDSTAEEAIFAGNWISDVRSLTWSDKSKFLYFTSGSEGVPKAVQVGMDAVRNRITWMWNAYPYESSDLVVVQKPLSFVASFWEVLGTLLAGVTGVLITNIERSRPDVMFDRLASSGATHLFTTPPALASLCDIATEKGSTLPQLRLACSSADQLMASVVRQFFEIAPRARVVNLYGATETSANTTSFEVSRSGSIPDPIPLGEPICATKIVIRDMKGNEKLSGEEGQICVQGAPVADGYIVNGQLSLGDDAFFTLGSGQREIRTGDLGIIKDGVLSLVGRLDNAVNIAGHKIHLEEVERAAARVANSTKQCGAVYHQGSGGVLALVIPREWESQVTTSRLAEFLPSYMIPLKIVTTQNVPRSRTGKIDRCECLKLVAQSELYDHDRISQGQMQRNSVHDQVQNIWDMVLGKKSHGEDRDFFSAGGNSLRAVQLLTAIGKQFGVRVPLRNFYSNPTISCLVSLLMPVEEREQ